MNTSNRSFMKSTNENQRSTLKIATPTPMKRKNKSKEELSTNINVQQHHQKHESQKQQSKIRNETTAKRQKIEHSNSNKSLVTITSQTEMSKLQTTATNDDGSNSTVVAGKPPLPPKPDKSLISQIMKVKTPPKMKRKLDETNAILVQKLNTLAEKLRLENADLMKALSSEKCAVRTLR